MPFITFQCYACNQMLKVGADSRAENPQAHEGLMAVVYGALASAGLAILVAMRLAVDSAEGYFRTGVMAASGYSFSFSLALMGAGHLVGLSVGLAMLAGILIAWAGAVPIITAMTPMHGELASFVSGIWRNDVRFIGAGAMAIAIAGQGMALSSDYVIGVAPAISAKAAGAAVSAAAVADRALALSLIAGAVALLLAYISIRNRKLIQPGSEALLEQWQRQSGNGDAKRLEPQGTFDKAEIARGTSYDEPLAIDEKLRHHLPLIEKRRAGWSKLFAILTPLGFAAVIAVMVLPKLGLRGIFPELKGGDAAALVGGMGTVLMILATIAA